MCFGLPLTLFFAKERKPTFISMVKYLKAKNKVDDRDWRIGPPLLTRGPIGVLAAKLAGDSAAFCQLSRFQKWQISRYFGHIIKMGPKKKERFTRPDQFCSDFYPGVFRTGRKRALLKRYFISTCLFMYLIQSFFACHIMEH